MSYAQQLMNTLACGSLYALIALGYSLVFGIVRLVNFAHCDVMMLGAYGAWVLQQWCPGPLWLTLSLTMVFCAAVGWGIQRWVYRPLFSARGEYLLVSAIGVSLVLEYGVAGLFGSAPKRLFFPELEGNCHLFCWEVPKASCFVLLACPTVLGGLVLLLQGTAFGRGMRAVSEDSMAAKLCGVHREKMIGAAFLGGSALAGLSGALYGSLYALTPLMGMAPGMKAFAAAVIGGIGSVPGAVLGGFLLSFFETGASLFLDSGLRDGISFLAMILTLLLFPGGIVGQRKGADRF